MAICTHCAAANPSGFRYCGSCGAPLVVEPADREARKVVTALFCDIAGSTALGEELDPEALHSVLMRYFDAIDATIERHGGTVQKFAGDAVLAVFGIPKVHEDDALRAVRAAVEIRDRLPSIAEEIGLMLRFRTGVNTGLVVTDEGKTLALGDAMNVAARLEQAARPGEILIGADTMALVRDAVRAEALEPLELKGRSEPVRAFRLLALDPGAPGRARRTDVAIVDRKRELAMLRGAWQRTRERSACELFTLIGAAGVGKSRLADELLSEIGATATTLRGRCLHYGEGITFWPIGEALATLGDVAAPIRRHISSGGAATAEELFWEVRRLLEAVATDRPVILHIDDLQWAEPMLLELLTHIVDLSKGSPILILCTARSELLDEHRGWAGGRPNSSTATLEPLGSDECDLLLDELGDGLAAETRRRVIDSSEGNPLFLQELAALAQEGGAVDVPPTIQALLAARLEGLLPGERELLARGAIEGQVFHRSALLALSPETPASTVDAQLSELVRKDLIRPDPGNLAGEDAFRFRHLLIRDAAYERISKGTRAELHAAYADWLELSGIGFAEVDEIAGWHLEQAVLCARDVRREADDALGLRAAEHLLAAGLRAADRSDVAAARNLLERALALAPAGGPLHLQVSLALADRLIEAGDLGRADELLAATEAGTEALGGASLSRLEWQVYSEPAEAARAIELLLPGLLADLARSGDDRRLAKAHWLAFLAEWGANRARPAAAQARLSAEHALRAGDIGAWSRALGWYVATLIYGPDSARAIGAELDAIEQHQPGPYLAACVELGRAEVERLEGRFDRALRFAEHARQGFTGLGMKTMTATCDHSLASIALAEGDLGQAKAALLSSDAILAEFGERAIRSTTQAMLARVYERAGDAANALAAAELADELSAPHDVANYAIIWSARARLATTSGQLDEAERAAQRAVEYALRTDFVGLQADARLALAEVLRARGVADRADREARAALELFTAKGDQPGCAAARAILT
jgi:class 3 adenylate cyclase